jgi:hypothetical protein
MFEPIPIPEGLFCEWYDSAKRIRSVMEFVQVCTNHNVSIDDKLVHWIQKNLLPEQDPIEKIVNVLQKIRASAPAKHCFGALPSDLYTKIYFNKETHEMDEFTAADSTARSNRWSLALFGEEYADRSRN